ncbi:MAG: helix-turn-helix transcriptional regulator [Clostridia bacterium]|nr:helix-turn-helix transcriptional regulator [Clostridia bacterium]
MTLGEKLQRLRKARGWTQEQLAERAGVSRQSLSKWESDGALPDTANVITMADLFGVTTDYLLREERRSSVEGTEEAPDEPAAAAAADIAPDAPGQPAGRLPHWMLAARWTAVAAALGLIGLRLGASLDPVNVYLDGERLGPFEGYLFHNDLGWAVKLLGVALFFGAVMGFGPWLVQLGRKWFTRFRGWWGEM